MMHVPGQSRHERLAQPVSAAAATRMQIAVASVFMFTSLTIARGDSPADCQPLLTLETEATSSRRPDQVVMISARHRNVWPGDRLTHSIIRTVGIRFFRNLDMRVARRI